MSRHVHIRCANTAALCVLAVFTLTAPLAAQTLTWSGPTSGSQNLTTNAIVAFTTPGTYTVSVSSAVTMTFKGVAGGGGGAAGATGGTYAGSGGGGGATSTGTALSLQAGKSYQLTVGAGGAMGAAGGATIVFAPGVVGSLTSSSATPTAWGAIGIALVPNGNISFDRATIGSYANSVSSRTVAHTVGTGANYLVVGVMGDLTADRITSVTYGGAAMTLLAKFNPGSNVGWLYLYGLANPAAGTANIVVSANAACAVIGLEAASYTGVATATAATTASAAAATSISTAVSPVNGAWTLQFSRNLSGTLSNSTGTVRVSETSDGLGSLVDGNGGGTLASTTATGTAWGAIGIALAPNGVISFDRGANGSYSGSASSRTIAYTVGAGADYLLVGVIGDVASDRVTSVTYNSIPMTLVAKFKPASGVEWVDLVGLSHPPTGAAYSIVVNANAVCSLIGLEVASYRGVAGVDPSSITTASATSATGVSTTAPVAAAGAGVRFSRNLTER